MFQSMYNHLYKNPVIGFISGLLSTVLLQVRSFLTDELLLKEVAGLGVWMATIVGVLSGIIYSIKVYDILKIRINRWREKRGSRVLPVILVLMIIFGVSCKTRQVNLEKTNSHEVSSVTVTGDSSKQSVNIRQLSSAFKDSVARVDSFDVEIATDTGVIRVANGVFTGKARSVKIKGKSTNNNVRSGINSQRDSSAAITNVASSKSEKQNKTTSSKSKTVLSKPRATWALWLTCIIAVFFVSLYVVKLLYPISPGGVPKMESPPPPPGDEYPETPVDRPGLNL